MMKFVLLLSWFFLSFDGPAFAQEREMILPVPQSAYSQAVKVKGGALVFLSGVGPTDEKGVLHAPGDYRGQVHATWEHMRRIMAKVSADRWTIS